MNKCIVTSLVVVALLTACIGQEWTVEDWKEHLFLMNPALSQDASTIMPGFKHMEIIPPGTHFAYKLEMVGAYLETDVPLSVLMDITFSGKEVIDGVDCFKADLFMTMEMSMSGQTIKMEMEGVEWIEESTGAPVKIDMRMTADMEGVDVPLPMEFTVERVGEAEYHGHQCYLFEMSQEMEVMGIDLGEMKIVQYMDKETFAIVRQVMTMGEQEIDTEYIEPPISGEVEWELGHKETISTELGTHECQIIILKQEGEEIGKMWVSKEFRTPLKYVITSQVEDTELTMTMILTAYEFE